MKRSPNEGIKTPDVINGAKRAPVVVMPIENPRSWSILDDIRREQVAEIENFSQCVLGLESGPTGITKNTVRIMSEYVYQDYPGPT
jgi:hypothetical protein